LSIVSIRPSIRPLQEQAMPDTPHRVLGIYPDVASADSVRRQLLAQGLAPDTVEILMPGPRGLRLEAKADSNAVRDDVLRDGAIGTAVGTLAGAAGTVALALVGVSLFVAAPVVGALAMLGWGASLGGLLGAIAGAQGGKGDVSDLVQDALASGHVVLRVQAGSAAQRQLAEQAIASSMGQPASGVAPEEALDRTADA
jgi:hypothetical protein